MADLGTVSILVDIRGQPLVKELATDLNTVALSEKKVSDATQRVMADFQRMKSIMKTLKTETDGASNSFQRFSAQHLQQTAQRMQGFEAVLANTRRGMGQMGMATQQVGYQVGDFLVQVQSGTNWMVAFGQQATQLVGILPSFAGKLGMSVTSLIGISTGLGIAIPLITAIGAAFMRTSEDTKKAKTALDELDSSLKSIDSTLRDWGNTKAAAAAGITVEELIGQRGIGQAKADVNAAKKTLADLQEKGKLASGLGGGYSFAFAEKGVSSEVTAAEKEVMDAQKRLSDLQKMLAEQQKRSYDEENTALQANFHMQVVAAKFGSDSAQAMQLDLEQRIDSYNREIDKQILSNRYSAEEGRILKETNAEFEKKLFAREELSRKEGEAYGLIADANKKAMYDETQNLAFKEQENKIQETLLKYGKDSVQVYEQKAELASMQVKAALEEKFAKDGISVSERVIIENAREAARQHETNAGLIASQADHAQELAQGLREAATAMNALQGFSEGLDKQLSEAIARVNALKTGANAAVAGKVAGLNFELEQKAKEALAKGVDPSVVKADTEKARQTISALEAKLAEESKLTADATAANKGAKDAEKDPLLKLQKQIALQGDLNSMTEAEQRVRQALGDSWATYSPTVIKGLEEQIQKQIELEDRLKEQQQIFDTVKTSMEDAFMGMVDGTKTAKDAFKSMAAAIIKELYNVLVVQQLVGSFDRATGQGAGLVGMIGSALFRADGGPVSAGQPYIVGERGPEMIIPKSSGMVLTNGQTKAALGGSSNESYVVNNNISVTGSDSAMVRQEIAKMIPQISSATKAAMIDAKRRGGQMGNAFR